MAENVKRGPCKKRITKETEIEIRLCLDGGDIKVDTGIGFFDHMLHSFAFHGGFGLELTAKGDLDVDFHHTVEDTGIVLGTALREAMGDKVGIQRFADVHIPMDEALSFAAVDVSGRPWLTFDANFPQALIGNYDSCLTEEFFRAFAINAGISLHLRVLYGSNSHHMTESLFKAAARVLREALTVKDNRLPSTKGVL
jgi:imidazoleglycerol-phosphate dehydratase